MKVTAESAIKELNKLAGQFPDVPVGDAWSMGAVTTLHVVDIVNLLNNQKAEIERLKECTTNTINTSIEFGLDKENQIKKAKSEAVKEFAERLIDIAVGNWEHKVDVATIDNRVKEMVGDSE